MSYSVEEFQKAIATGDTDNVFYAFISAKDHDMAAYMSPKNFETFIATSLASRLLLDSAHQIRFFIDSNVQDKETKNSYETAFANGVRTYYQNLLQDGDFQALTRFLLHFANDIDDGREIANKVFDVQDITDMSGAFLKLEMDKKADYNFFHYGLFCLAMSKREKGNDPFQDLRKAIPHADLVQYRTIYKHHGASDLVSLLASGPEFDNLIDEKETLVAIHVHLNGPYSAKTMERMQKHPVYKSFFETNMPVILNDMIHAEKPDLYQINKTIRMMDYNGVAGIVSQEQAIRILSLFAGQKGHEVKFSETLEIMAKRDDFKTVATPEQIAVVARRLADFPPREKHLDQRGEAEFSYMQKIDENVRAFSTIAKVASKHGLLDILVPDDFEKAAAATYRDGTTLSSSSDIYIASKLRADFRAAYARGLMSVETPRGPYRRVTGYNAGADKLIFAKQG